MTSWTKI